MNDRQKLEAICTLLVKFQAATMLVPARITLSKKWAGELSLEPRQIMGIPVEIYADQEQSVTLHAPPAPPSLVLVDPPRFVNVGSKKVYLTANAFYAGTWQQRKAVKKLASLLFLEAGLVQLPKLQGPIWAQVFVFDTTKPDIDNAGYLWCKLALDALVRAGKIADDSVDYVQEVSYRFAPGPRRIEIKFIQLNTPKQTQ